MKLTVRFEIFKRDDFQCRYCGKRSPEAILEVDHVLPRASGGTDDYDNLVTACFECNRGKGARLLTQAPDELNLHEKTILVAEQELQVAEYNFWRAKQKEREDAELAHLIRIWKHSGYSIKRNVMLGYLRKLGVVELTEIVQIVNEDTTKDYFPNASWDQCAWRFFCSLCKRRIIERDGEV